MLTIASLPKAFQGHTGVIQRNAIRSWMQLRPECEIILLGNDAGTSEIAREFGLKHFPDIECNEYGTPLVNSLFTLVQQYAGNELVCYINADIILLSHFTAAVERIPNGPFLLAGRRWDLDVTELINFSDSQWEKQLSNCLSVQGKLHGASGIDYFLFRRGMYTDIPPFAIGRTAWDNWLIYKARTLGAAVIDGTGTITIIHQNHDHNHISSAPKSEGASERKGIEGRRNRELLGGDYYGFDLWDATHLLLPGRLEKVRGRQYFLYRILRFPEMHPRLIPLVQILRLLRTIVFKTAPYRRALMNKLKQ